MKLIQNIKVIVVFIVLATIFTACASLSDNKDTDTVSTVSDAASDSESGGVSAVTADEPTPTPLPGVDKKSSADSVLGSWIDTDNSEKFVNITKAEVGFLYEDNDGKYNASFRDGILEVYASESDTAIVYYDFEAGCLKLEYDGAVTTFKKKD